MAHAVALQTVLTKREIQYKVYERHSVGKAEEQLLTCVTARILKAVV